jgi:hypothetical protein
MIEGLTARQVIEMIANEYYELSHDKIKLQRDDHVRWCKQWLELNTNNESVTEVEHWKRKYRDMHNSATHAMCRLHELEKERQRQYK